MWKVLNWTIFAVVLLAAWWFMGPVQFGGPVDYVIVEGDSMQPTYRDGDLVIARSKSSYEVGEIITYRPELQIGTDYPVIHRIVEVTAGGEYTTQGDNREEVDGWSATDDNIVGESWLHIPRAGAVLQYVSRPASLAGLAVGLFVLHALKRRERQLASFEALKCREKRGESEPVDDEAEAVST